MQTMVGFKSTKCDWLVLNSKQEGIRLMGFKYQKADDWLDSKFHCSYQESRGVAEKKRWKYGEKMRELGIKRTGNYPLSFSVPVTSLPVMQLPVTSFPITSSDLISSEVTAPHCSPASATLALPLCYFDR